jgi:hypothetical protein
MLRLRSVRKPALQVILVCLASTAFWAAASVSAESTGGPGGTWPKSWPKELEPLRKQAWTWHNGLCAQISYDIAFADREQFEASWPHILKLKSKGAPITLLRGPYVRVWTTRPPKSKTAGVIILLPLEGSSEGPLSVTQIKLVVDGAIVDLNRIPLPADTPIIDERFKVTPVKPAAGASQRRRSQRQPPSGQPTMLERNGTARDGPGPDLCSSECLARLA